MLMQLQLYWLPSVLGTIQTYSYCKGFALADPSASSPGQPVTSCYNSNISTLLFPPHPWYPNFLYGALFFNTMYPF